MEKSRKKAYRKIFPFRKRVGYVLELLVVRLLNILLQLFMFILQVLLILSMILNIQWFMEYIKIFPKTFHKSEKLKHGKK